jgi:CheY-like chemotaxis protein
VRQKKLSRHHGNFSCKNEPRSHSIRPKGSATSHFHVDDELDLLKTTKLILESIGPFQVETALSVKEAIKKLEETEFDVIVSDYQMQEKDCLEFLRELRENENNIPLILFTGKGREEIAIKALNLGASR